MFWSYRTKEMAGHLDQIPKAGLAFGVHKLADLIGSYRHIGAQTLTSALKK